MNLVRPPRDDRVDRPDVDALQGAELTGTNRPRACPTHHHRQLRAYPLYGSRPPHPPHGGWCATHVSHNTIRVPSGTPQDSGVPVAMAGGKHPVPFRTRKLSLHTLMVLPTPVGGRVRRRRNTTHTPEGGAPHHAGPLPLFTCPCTSPHLGPQTRCGAQRTRIMTECPSWLPTEVNPAPRNSPMERASSSLTAALTERTPASSVA